MKLYSKLYLLGMAFFMPLISTACGGQDNDVKNPNTSASQVSVNVQPEFLNPDFNAQTIELTVNANVDWSIRTDANWISIRPAGGVKNENTVVKVSLEANKEFESRNAEINIYSESQVIKSINLEQGFVTNAFFSESSVVLSGESGSRVITVTANYDWTITNPAEWLSVTPLKGEKGETQISISAEANETASSRETTLTLTCGESSSQVKVSQLNYGLVAPEGYTLVWSDEFNYEGKPSSDWVIENQAAGWVNHELQTYTSREVDGRLTLEVKDGFLHVNCFKAKDGKIYSGRMNAKPGTGWTYGYFEARINLPSGKGTWPAFWMMPSNVDWSTNGWPKCGEIDIMEEVGVDANKVSSSLHTEKYNHTKGTQKTHEMYLAGAEGDFHVYALEWTPEEITTYVDGKVQLNAKKSQMGSDHDSWPFHYAFYPILNLAWGGDWGGYAGVDENALPVTMLVDYVRIFQKQ